MPPDQTREGERARGFDWPRPPGLNTPLLSELLLSAVSAVRGGGDAKLSVWTCDLFYVAADLKATLSAVGMVSHAGGFSWFSL